MNIFKRKAKNEMDLFKEPKRGLYHFFMEFYRSKKELENIGSYVRERSFQINHCARVGAPSKDLMRRYGLRGNSEYWEVWAILEQHFNEQGAKKYPDELQPK